MDGRWKIIWKGSGQKQLWHFPGGTEEKHKKPVGIAGDQAEIQTVHLSNTR
jgi:hypothetical protein